MFCASGRNSTPQLATNANNSKKMIAQNANHIANTLLIPIPKYLLFKLSPGF
jgi:hypothetical protein